jgi:hypothetical protein
MSNLYGPIGKLDGLVGSDAMVSWDPNPTIAKHARIIINTGIKYFAIIPPLPAYSYNLPPSLFLKLIRYMLPYYSQSRWFVNE